jgi:hypothetical protein
MEEEQQRLAALTGEQICMEYEERINSSCWRNYGTSVAGVGSSLGRRQGEGPFLRAAGAIRFLAAEEGTAGDRIETPWCHRTGTATDQVADDDAIGVSLADSDLVDADDRGSRRSGPAELRAHYEKTLQTQRQ